MVTVFDKFSGHLKQTMERAVETARKFKLTEITPLHLLYFLSEQKGSLAHEILLNHKIAPATFDHLFSDNTSANKTRKKQLQRARKNSAAQQIPFSDKSKNLLTCAALLASKFYHPYVGTEHLLAAIMEKPTTDLLTFFEKIKLDGEKLKQSLAGILRATSRLPDMTTILKQIEQEENQWHGESKSLSKYATDLTDKNLQKKINPVIGREKEIERMVQILCRRDKNNPIILGDPGVGKTALVEGLAKKISENKVPNILLGKKILALDLSLMVAGTSYRGEFEQRIKTILDEIRKDPNTIIFIDELHTLVGAGAASGSLDAANILKPLLGRGELRCIGATTMEEYKKHIEPDAALSRRFQAIILREPTANETFKILNGIKTNYEEFHRVKFTNESINAAVELSGQYLPEKFWPDKAIDLLDESASRANMNFLDKNPRLVAISALKNQLSDAQKEKNVAVTEEKFDTALKLKELETALKIQIEKIENETKTESVEPPEIHAQDMARIISQKTGVPLEDIAQTTDNALQNMEKELNEKIIGQETIIKEIIKILKRHRIGLNDPNKPIASLMLAGPSGVGKTFLARALAEIYFHNEKATVHLNMSEFNDKMSATKLIGAPAGYIGYREGNILADALKKTPHCIVLFDEIEKAHPEIHNLILQILDKGEITDANGKLINFKNCIILCTCNIGSELWNKHNTEIGFAATQKNENHSATEQTLEKIKKHFSENFLNRLNKVLFFNNLNSKNFKKIVNLNIEELNKKLTRKNIRLALTDKAISHLSEEAKIMRQGSRGINKLIEQRVENLLLDGALSEGELTIDLDSENKQLTLTNAN